MSTQFAHFWIINKSFILCKTERGFLCVFENQLWALNTCWDWVWSMKLHLKGLHLTPWNDWELGRRSVPWLFAETFTRGFRQKWQGQTPLQQLGALNRSGLLWRHPCPDCWLRGQKGQSSKNTHIFHALTEHASGKMSFVCYGIFYWGCEWERMNLSDGEQVWFSFFGISTRTSQKKYSLSQNIHL